MPAIAWESFLGPTRTGLELHLNVLGRDAVVWVLNGDAATNEARAVVASMKRGNILVSDHGLKRIWSLDWIFCPLYILEWFRVGKG